MDRTPSVDAELSHIKTLLEVLVQDTKSMKERLGEIGELDKKMARLEVKQDEQTQEGHRLAQKLEAFQSAKEEVESFVDRVKGALILIGFLQAVLLGGATWIVTQVVDSRQDLAVLQFYMDKHVRDQEYRIAPQISPER